MVFYFGFGLRSSRLTLIYYKRRHLPTSLCCPIVALMDNASVNEKFEKLGFSIVSSSEVCFDVKTRFGPIRRIQTIQWESFFTKAKRHEAGNLLSTSKDAPMTLDDRSDAVRIHKRSFYALIALFASKEFKS